MTQTYQAKAVRWEILSEVLVIESCVQQVGQRDRRCLQTNSQQ